MPASLPEYLFAASAAFSVVAYVAFLALFARARRALVSPERSPIEFGMGPALSPELGEGSKGQPAELDTPLPPVTLLKPCAGLEDSLEACLDSYCRIEYPRFQIVFGVRDARDPALAVIERVIARHPGLDAAVAVGTLGHASPKVDNLAVCASLAKYPLYWASDSNTRAGVHTLKGMVAQLLDERAAALVSPIAGEGEETPGSALESLHLCVFATVAGVAVWNAIGRVAAAGKSCLVRREALERVGGWGAIGRYHGDDVMLLKLLRRAGLRAVLGRHVVANVTRRARVSDFLARHGRWAQIRMRTVTPAALGEPWMYPFAAPIAYALVFPSRISVALLVLSLALQGAGDAWSVRAVRGPGRGLAWKHLPLIWLRPLLLVALWARALVERRTRWRGEVSYLGRDSEVLPVPPRRVISRPSPARTRP